MAQAQQEAVPRPRPVVESRAAAAGTAASQLAWVLGAAGLGFALAAVFSGMLRIPRAVFLAPYALAAVIYLEAYRRRSRIDLGEDLRRHWLSGLVGAVAVGSFVVWSVLRQPGSPRPEGVELVFDLLWLGVVYGAVDGLLLSVLPVAASWRALEVAGWTARPAGRLGAGALALLASLFVTAAYHLGYPEFRGANVAGPVVGCGAMSLAFLLSRNPMAAILSHIAMHVAAVLHGIDSTVQLPPHG